MIEDFEAFVQDLERRSGEISFAACDLSSGTVRSRFPDRKVKTASVIKLPILVHVALSCAEGGLDWETPLKLTDEEKAGGAGVLSGMTAGITLSLRDACYLMTTISDNTATNMVIESVGKDGVNQRMRSLGLEATTLNRKAYSPDTPESLEFGLGVTTAMEMANLLTIIEEDRFEAPEARQEILRMLAAQSHREAIPRTLPADWKYWGKTGAIDHLRNDVGLVEAPDERKFALALFCQKLPLVQWTVDNPGILALAELSKALLLG